MEDGIDLIYSTVTKKIMKEDAIGISMQLLSRNNNSERVKLVYGILKQYNMFPNCIQDKKSSEVSEKHRNMGNEEYKNYKNNRALKMYNIALRNAPPNSKEVCLAYSNRSAVNFTKKNYADSLKDIDRAFRVGYITHNRLKEKLNKRKLACEEALKESSNSDDLDSQCAEKFKLSKPSHKTISVASESLELTYSKEMGRCVSALQDIVPGEVLVEEEPYCCLVLEPFYSKYCYGCLKRCHSMIPCDECCYAMFCDEECQEKAYRTFHKIDCKLMKFLFDMRFTKIELLALRMVIQAKCTHKNCDSLKEVILKAESVEDPLLKGFVLDPSGDQYVLDSQNYSSIHMLESNVEKRGVSDIFQKSITASVCLYALIEHTDFFNDCNILSKEDSFSNECVSLYGGLLLHHNMTSPSNTHTISITTASLHTGYTENLRFGGGAFAFFSLLNHSCAPNVVRFNNGSTMILVALRPIKKGEQLFDNYGYHHAIDEFTDRQKSLMFQYKFKCCCEACSNNWPMYFNLRPAKITNRQSKKIMSSDILNEKLIEDLSKGDRKVALKTIDRLYPFVVALEECAPCKQLADYQETIKQCWELFGNIEPFDKNDFE